ncbi:MAG: hypothetical protein WBX00_04445 [Isosphaeraceae bacterium]
MSRSNRPPEGFAVSAWPVAPPHLPSLKALVNETRIEISGGFELAQPRRLPFTFRSRLPSWPWLVWVYLRLPLLWRFFGAQFFLVGRKAT